VNPFASPTVNDYEVANDLSVRWQLPESFFPALFGISTALAWPAKRTAKKKIGRPLREIMLPPKLVIAQLRFENGVTSL
jgi:hypothetical protein